MHNSKKAVFAGITAVSNRSSCRRKDGHSDDRVETSEKYSSQSAMDEGGTMMPNFWEYFITYRDGSRSRSGDHLSARFVSTIR